jgi:hypothetical protein
MNIVINTELSATESIVQNLDDANVASVPTLFLGDQHNIVISFGNNAGGFSGFTGRGGHQIMCGVGIAETRTTFTRARQRGFVGGNYYFRLDLNTNELRAEMAGAQEKTLNFEVQISYANGTTQTLCQMPVVVRNTLIETLYTPQEPSLIIAI